ncbi:MAG: FAD-dependent oxidoreductase [Actinobacteria bacterium]|nr:FAD-dependent oxidoreductase [Actinomycetota bacterium]
MAKPIILSVDDDRHVLEAVERDLRGHYGDDYRVVAAESGAEALDALEELQRRGAAVALLLADQRMPGMEGTEFLERSMALAPDARRVLLTAYADTQAAIDAINRVGLDHYLMKPWDPPDELLFPVLDDLLDTWQATTERPFDGIRVAGTTWSPGTHDVKDFLARSLIPYRFLDVERDGTAAAMVGKVDDPTLPVVFFPDGSVLSAPTSRELAAKIGLKTAASMTFYDLIVLGAGPAGLAAAVYGASEGLRTAVIERGAIGGQAGTSSRIENYLGFPTGIAGADLARRAATQAQRLGAELITATEVVSVRVEGPLKIVTLTDGSEVSCKALVVATGMTVRRLSVPGYERFEGAGVYYGAAASEVSTYRDEDVFVVGGANSAGQAAMMFSAFCRKVSLVVRGADLGARMSQYLVDQVTETPNIEVLLGTQIIEVGGGDRVEWLRLRTTATGAEEQRDASGIFVFVGAVPHTGVVADVVHRNEQGFIPTGPDLVVGGRVPGWTLDRDPYLMETNVPGIFAAGDARHGVVRRVASAVGQGSVVVSMVHQYLSTV